MVMPCQNTPTLFDDRGGGKGLPTGADKRLGAAFRLLL
jgi:hypothetical protein